MYAMERQELIEQLIRDEKRVGVLDLARRFEVTTETVRRDLDRLEQLGRVRRVHGGAVGIDADSMREASVAERLLAHGAAKRAIAQRATRMLGESFRGSVYIDAGTTTAAVAAMLPRTLANDSARAELVTHSMTIASELASSDISRLTVIGGRVRGVTAAAVGSETVRAVSKMRPDVAFIGTNGISAGFGLSTPDPEEAAVKAAIVRAARRVIVVADGTKFGEELLVRFADLPEIDAVVTDREPPAELAHALRDADVEVVRA